MYNIIPFKLNQMPNLNIDYRDRKNICYVLQDNIIQMFKEGKEADPILKKMKEYQIKEISKFIQLFICWCSCKSFSIYIS